MILFMVYSPINHDPARQAPIGFLLWLLITAAVVMGGPAGATAAEQPAVLNDIGTIRISADSLTVPGGAERQAVFSGNVHAVGDRFEITADRLKIYYQSSAGSPGDDISTGNNLEKIIAIGNVVITSGEKIAKTQEAVYDKDQQTIVLTGEQSMVQQNNSFISGAKIIMHTDSEAVSVEGENGKRVEAFINAGEIRKNN